MGENTRRLALIGASLALTVACDSSPGPGGDRQDLVRGTDGFRDFGDYVVYVNALLTNQLTPDIASEYGIVRSNNRAMLTVSVHKKGTGSAVNAVRADISSRAVNLTGQERNVLLREVTEEDAVYYIGEVDVNEQETLMYSIEATPADDEERSLSLRYQKQFFAAE